MALHDLNFALIITRTNGEETQKIYHGSCHAAKVQGGREFHADNVKSVGVFDTNGKPYLYLVAGHPEKTENVKSPY